MENETVADAVIALTYRDMLQIVVWPHGWDLCDLTRSRVYVTAVETQNFSSDNRSMATLNIKR